MYFTCPVCNDTNGLVTVEGVCCACGFNVGPVVSQPDAEDQPADGIETGDINDRH